MSRRPWAKGGWALGPSSPPGSDGEENKYLQSGLPVGHFGVSHSRGWEEVKGEGPGAETHPAGQGYKRAGQSAERGVPGERRITG